MMQITGACIGGVEAVEFFEKLEDRITPEEKETYQRAMNRIRYETAKGIGVKKRVVKAVKSWHTDKKVCGKCGFGADTRFCGFFHAGQNVSVTAQNIFYKA